MRLRGETRSDWDFPDDSAVFKLGPASGAHESPASSVLVTLENVFGLKTLPVPEPSRIPAQASLIVLF